MRIVVCHNSRPMCVLAEGTTEVQAKEYCDKLQKEHPDNQDKNARAHDRAYFHWHVLKEVTL